MKMSVSLPSEDVEFLDDYAREHAIGSRSAALHRAVDLLRAAQLGDAYADAWDEWEQTGEASVWEPATADGLSR
ncbi:ribbon-helix-helix domain-containing protein [Prauserella cavernicola]|uniref:Antitoxin n=1 Tax=Prauserella cavernicola TaxID=2800127 RepID=A0A934V6T3_9PSEU|nr:ribbon-helix-helix domain-containing protein [Prauserella cavernicola]MBK1787014.1 antitoxin [Prauserella cavernicola]